MIHINTLGHIGADPIKKLVNGQTLWSMNLAVQHKKETIWVKINWWGESSFIEKFVKKGSFVVVAGVLNPLSFYKSQSGDTTANLTVTLQDIHFGPKREGTHETKQEVKEEAFDDLPF